MIGHESDRAKSNAKRGNPGRIWPDWYPALATFKNSDNRKATWQLINTIVPYCGLWYLMIRSIQLDYSYTLTLILALLAAAFMVRLFILFHDCVHGSFFRRQNVNTFIGYFFNFLLGFNTINKKGLIMTRNTLLSRPIIAITFLGFLFADPFIRAASPSELETVENQVNARSKNSKDFAEGQITVQFSQNEADSISEILPEGEVRQMFKNKLSIGGRKDDSSSEG